MIILLLLLLIIISIILLLIIIIMIITIIMLIIIIIIIISLATLEVAEAHGARLVKTISPSFQFTVSSTIQCKGS